MTERSEIGVAHAGTSSARRRPARGSGGGLLPVVLLAVGLLLIGMWLASRTARHPEPEPVPTPSPRALVPVAGPPSPSPTVTPTPTFVAHASEWTSLAPAPSPTPTLAPASTPQPRRGPTPTPRVSECVEITWHGGQSGTDLSKILITVEAHNHCGREVGVDEVWIWAAGYRDGALGHSTRGHFFRPLGTTFPVETTLALEGSVSWYDKIVVRVYGPEEIR